MVERRLIRDADRGLEGVEAPALDLVARRRAVSAVADVARLSPLAGPLQGLDDVTLAQLSLGAAVELDQVDVVGPEAAQTPLDALGQRARPPVRAPVLRGMTALREEVVLRAPGRGRSAAPNMIRRGDRPRGETMDRPGRVPSAADARPGPGRGVERRPARHYTLREEGDR